MHAKRLEEARRIRRALGVGGGAALVLLVLLQLGGREAYTRDPGDGGYGAGTGEHRVRVADSIEIRDQSRAKNLQVKAYYPEDQGRYPVIVFSHGALGSKNGYEPLVRHWASQGYVVILPTHDDSLSLRRSSGERKTLREEISDPEAWQNRPKDVSLVLDSLGEIERRAPGLVGRMDTSRIGVGGIPTVPSRRWRRAARRSIFRTARAGLVWPIRGCGRCWRFRPRARVRWG